MTCLSVLLTQSPVYFKEFERHPHERNMKTKFHDYHLSVLCLKFSKKFQLTGTIFQRYVIYINWEKGEES